MSGMEDMAINKTIDYLCCLILLFHWGKREKSIKVIITMYSMQIGHI